MEIQKHVRSTILQHEIDPNNIMIWNKHKWGQQYHDMGSKQSQYMIPCCDIVIPYMLSYSFHVVMLLVTTWNEWQNIKNTI